MLGMTGFGTKEAQISGICKIRVEVRSTNHKFLEIGLQVPEGFSSLEGLIKKEIEARIRRGRVTCTVNLIGSQPLEVCINKELLKNYLRALHSIRGEFHIKNEISTDTLVRLPGILSVAPAQMPKPRIWKSLKTTISGALQDLTDMRTGEGQAIEAQLKACAQLLKKSLEVVKQRFKVTIKERLAAVKTDEERSSLLKETDITEEIERLSFHVKNFSRAFLRKGPVGKELDFIAQEMQRETNTIGAKCCDTVISAEVIRIKSQIDKIREQAQNIE